MIDEKINEIAGAAKVAAEGESENGEKANKRAVFRVGMTNDKLPMTNEFPKPKGRTIDVRRLPLAHHCDIRIWCVGKAAATDAHWRFAGPSSLPENYLYQCQKYAYRADMCIFNAYFRSFFMETNGLKMGKTGRNWVVLGLDLLCRFGTLPGSI